MTVQKIETSAAPAAIGPYSQGIRAGDFIFFSGQIPLDPDTGAVVSGGVDAQTRQVMKNMEALLLAAGRSFRDVVKTTIYLTDLSDFETVNGIYGGYFGETPPARATIQVAALPKGVCVEIESVVYCGAE